MITKITRRSFDYCETKIILALRRQVFRDSVQDATNFVKVRPPFRFVLPATTHQPVYLIRSTFRRRHPVTCQQIDSLPSQINVPAFFIESITRADHLPGTRVGEACVRCAAPRENFPAEDSEAPDVAQGRVLAVVEGFGCRPLDGYLLHAVRDDVLLFLA